MPSREVSPDENVKLATAMRQSGDLHSAFSAFFRILATASRICPSGRGAFAASCARKGVLAENGRVSAAKPKSKLKMEFLLTPRSLAHCSYADYLDDTS
jgi:hypothetical protein